MVSLIADSIFNREKGPTGPNISLFMKPTIRSLLFRSIQYVDRCLCLQTVNNQLFTVTIEPSLSNVILWFSENLWAYSMITFRDIRGIISLLPGEMEP